MDESQKKGPGGRDISDLKARLGLKKGAGGGIPAPVPPTATPPPPTAGGAPVPAPPGFGPPAGAEPAGPEAPSVPVDVRRDPFAAPATPSAPPAYYGYAPLPGTDDGKPAEQLSKPTPWSRIAVLAVGGLAILLFGYFCGGIRWARGNMNRTIDQSQTILDEVHVMAKKLGEINDTINASPDALKNRPDVALAEKLGELDLKKPDQEKIFHTNYFFLDDLSIDDLFSYYNDTIILYDLVAQNAKKTAADKDAITRFMTQATKQGAKYGVIYDKSGPIPVAHFVEVGNPVCPKAGDVNCKADELKGLQFRMAAGQPWAVRPVHGDPAKTVTPIEPSPLFQQALSGSPDILAVRDAVRRVAEIRRLTAKLMAEQKELTSKLEQHANQPKLREFLLF